MISLTCICYVTTRLICDIINVQAVHVFIHSIKVTAKKVWSIDVTAKVVVIDHSDALKNGFMAVFPNAKLTTDWPHIAHKIKQTRSQQIKDTKVMLLQCFICDITSLIHDLTPLICDII